MSVRNLPTGKPTPRHRRPQFGVVAVLVGLLALLASNIALAQADDPLVCDGTFYQVRREGSSTTLYALDRSGNPYVANALYSFSPAVNAMGYNAIDNHLYSVGNPTSGTSGMYRLGLTGLVDLNGADPGQSVPVTDLPNAGFDGGDIDAQGHYFLVQGGGGPLRRIDGITGPTPTPSATVISHGTDASPPAGYTGHATFLIGDIAVHPTESTAARTVIYGVRAQETGTVYLYRIAVDNPGLGSAQAHVSRIATTLPQETFGSVFFDVSGRFYAYSNSANAVAGFYTVDLTTGAATNVSGASSANASDGGSCVFADFSLDVVKSAGTVNVIDATTFQVPYSIVVGNLGTTTVPNVQVSDNLNLTYADGSPTIDIITGPTAGAPCTVNAGFNGTSDYNLLAGSDSLAAGQSCTITFTVEVSYASLIDVPAAPQLNSAFASAVAGTDPNPGYTFPGGTPVPPPGLIADDTSTDSPTLPGDPGGDTPTPTPVQFPHPPRVSVTKTANPPGALTPGGSVVYTVVVTNNGSTPAPGTVVNDPLPAGIDSSTWTCASSGGAVCPNASGSGAISETVATFPAGSSLTWTITAQVSDNPPANVINTASVTPPDGLCFPDDSAPPCSDSVSNPPLPIVNVNKSTSNTIAIPGGTVVWSVVVSNTGSVPADGTMVSDPLPSGVDSATWTCAATGGAVCPNASGTGAINETIATFPAGSQVTWTLTGTVATDPPANIVNSVSVTPPSGGICQDGSTAPCEDDSTIPAAPQVSIAKSADPPGSLIPGGTVQYLVTVSNGGSVAAPGTHVQDAFPVGIDSANWTCASTGGAICPALDSGGTITPPSDLLDEVIATFPAGSSLTWTIVAQVSTTPPASVVNTATATPPDGGVCLPDNSAPPCSTSVSNPPVPVIELVKTASETVLIPGETVTYTVTARNLGSVPANGTVVTDPVPMGLTTPFDWTCAASGGAVCPNASGSGAINENVATFPAGSELVWTITATVADNPPAIVANTATATPPAGSICADGSTAPCDSTVELPVVPQVSVTKTADVSEAVPGGSIIWTVTVSNVGATAANGTLVADPVPAGITGTTWTCTESGGAVCPNASGAGALNEIIATFPAGGELVYIITGTVADPAPLQIVNTVSVTPPNDGRCLPGNSLPPCTDSTTTPSAPAVTLLKVLADEDGEHDGVAEPGEQLTYTITLTNTGGSAATGFGVSDQLDANVNFVSADNGGSHAAGVVTWSGLTVPAGGSLVLTVVVEVVDPLPAGVSQISNVAYETGTTPPDCPPAGAQCVIIPTPGAVVLAKALVDEDGTQDGVAEPGEQLTYTITLTNSGGADVTGYGVTDQLDANVAFVSADNGGSHAAGVVTWSGLTVPAGGSLVLTVVTEVADPIPAGVTQIANLAYETGTTPPSCPPAGSQCVIIPVIGSVTLVKALTAESGSEDGVAEPGEQLTYTITLNNTGGAEVTGFGVTDQLDANVSFVSADNGGVHAAGVVTWSGLTVPAGGSLVLTVVTEVADPIPAGVTQIANLAYQTGTTPPSCPPAGSQCVIIPVVGSVTLVKALTAESGSEDGVAEPGEQLTYTITLTNTGGADVTAYGVSDQLDANVSFVSADNGGAHAAGVVTWSALTIPAGGSLVLTVVTQVADPIPAGVTQIANLAYETGTTPPSCPPAGSQCVTIPTQDLADLAIIKSVDEAAPSVGDQVTFTLTVTNHGPSDATGVLVNDELPDGYTFVSATPSVGNWTAPVWTIGDLASGDSATLSLLVTVNESGEYLNTATVSGDQEDPNPDNNTDDAVVAPVGEGALAVSKTVSSGTAVPGASVIYTVTVANVGTVAVDNVMISDPLPAGVVSTTWTCTALGGVACPAASGSGALAEAVASFPVGGELVYTITAQLAQNPPATVLNVVTVTPETAVRCEPEGTPAPCQADVPVTVGGGPNPDPALPVPLGGPWALLLMLFGLLGGAWLSRHRFA